MIGRYVSDLQVGDRLGPIEYTITPFLCREYAHGVEDGWDGYHRAASPDVPQLLPPTYAHANKIRVFAHACPEGAGPVPRIHVEYDATYHRPVHAGMRVRGTGEVTERYVRNGREWLVCVFELRDTETGELMAANRDSSIIGTVSAEPA